LRVFEERQGAGLEVQQSPLSIDSTCVSGQRSIGSHDPVARDDDRDRVPAIGGADGPNRIRRSDPLGKLSVADASAPWYPQELVPDATLEFGA